MARSTDPVVMNSMTTNPPAFVTGVPVKPLHRLGEVRKQQGISFRTLSRRTGIEVRELRRQEESADLSLRDFLRWQTALEVPVDELLMESQDSLSPGVRDRAQLVRVMKTVMALAEVASNTRAQRMLEMLREQLLQLMPELAQIVAWPSFGSRRPNEGGSKLSESQISVRNLIVESGDENGG